MTLTAYLVASLLTIAPAPPTSDGEITPPTNARQLYEQSALCLTTAQDLAAMAAENNRTLASEPAVKLAWSGILAGEWLHSAGDLVWVSDELGEHGIREDLRLRIRARLGYYQEALEDMAGSLGETIDNSDNADIAAGGTKLRTQIRDGATLIDKKALAPPEE